MRALILLALLSGPVAAQEPRCFTVEEALEIMRGRGFETFGELLYKDGSAIYYGLSGLVFAAPIVDGCVAPQGEPVKDFIPPEPVTRA